MLDAQSEILSMVSEMENQSKILFAVGTDENDKRDTYTGYRQFVEQIDKFYNFSDVVEGRLPELQHAKKAELQKHVVQIRWKITVLELENSKVYLVNISSDGKVLPLGAREFFLKRIDRIREVIDYFDRYGTMYDLKPIDPDLLDVVQALLKDRVAATPKLYEFTPQPVTRTTPAQAPFGAQVKKPAPPRPAARQATPQIKVKEVWGRFYASADSMSMVTEACRSKSMTLDQLAQIIGISRINLTLMLSGQDPMSKAVMEKVQAFLRESGRN